MKNLFTSSIQWVKLLTGSILTLLLAACTDELTQRIEQQTVEENTPLSTPSTLSVSLAETDTRLVFDKTDYDGRDAFLSTWSESDGFRLVGTKPTDNGRITEDATKSMEYLLAYGAGTTEGIFSSDDTPFESDAFILYYPATLKSYGEYGLFSYEGQVQRGNDNYDHIADYHAMYLPWMHDLDNIVLNASNEDFRQSSCMKFVLNGLPETFIPTSLQWSIVDSEGNLLTDVLLLSNDQINKVQRWELSLENFEPTNSITAYLMMSDQDITLPQGAQMRVNINGQDGEYYYADKPAGGKTIQGGCLNTLTITEGWTKPYESTDYSRHGKIETLQIAEQGEERGIDVVIVGEGFSDRLIADGTYDRIMQKAYEDFFCIEPYISFKKKFNVYQIDAVSKHEDMEYKGRETAFGCWFGTGTHVDGDEDKILPFVKSALNADDERMNSLLIVVLINSTRYAGTCHIWGGNVDNDFGEGIAIAYVPTGTSDNERRSTLLHECGHGFAKLADEYVNIYAPIHPITVSELKIWKVNYGCYKNIDLTNNPNEVCWKEFIGDSRYPEIDIFEGGDGYAFGVYRPTETSIMDNNVGEFNAPSRRAIFYRINKLLDPTFTDDYETFVRWDMSRDRVQHPATGTRAVDRKDFVPLAPPIVQIGYWQNGVFITE